ncbi:MAG TPA: GtrA family protein [Stenotrophobium sp.]|nr:GtrA family protein [Stenotrophobium sp.]
MKLPWRERNLRGQVLRFGTVGLSATAIHAGVYTLLTARWHIDALPATAAAFCCAFGISFLGHRYWTFAHNGSAFSASLLKFLCTSLLGLCSNAYIAWQLVDRMHLPASSALIGVVFLTPLLVFVLARFWVFAAPRHTPGYDG